MLAPVSFLHILPRALNSLSSSSSNIVRFLRDAVSDCNSCTSVLSDRREKFTKARSGRKGDGRIVAAGSAELIPHSSGDFALARYTSDGSLDPTFGGDRKVTIDFAGNDDRAFAVAIQGDGMIVAAGYADVSGNQDDFALAWRDPGGAGPPTCSGRPATIIGTPAAQTIKALSKEMSSWDLGGRT